MEKIYELLSQIRPEFDFRSSDDFISDGLLDSFDVVALVEELESTFDCIIDGLDVVPENFNTVDNIIKLIKRNNGNI